MCVWPFGLPEAGLSGLLERPDAEVLGTGDGFGVNVLGVLDADWRFQGQPKDLNKQPLVVHWICRDDCESCNKADVYDCSIAERASRATHRSQAADSDRGVDRVHDGGVPADGLPLLADRAVIAEDGGQ